MKSTLRICLVLFILTTNACDSNTITPTPEQSHTVPLSPTRVERTVATAAPTSKPRPLASATSHLPNTPLGQTSVPADLARDAALSHLPLRLGATWVYSATYRQNYRDTVDGRSKATPELVATYLITDSVVQIQEEEQAFIAQVQQEVTQTGGEVFNWFSGLGKPDTQQYWYIVVGRDIYMQQNLDLNHLDLAYLPYKTPLAQQTLCWWPSPDERAIYPELVGCEGTAWGTRHVEGPVAVRVRNETYPVCLSVIETHPGVADTESLCPGIGIVRRNWDYIAQSAGETFEATSSYQQELIQYTP